MYEQKPWLKFYQDIPESITYPEKTMFQMVELSAEKYPQYQAYEFLGTTSTYRTFLEDINRCADGLAAVGFKRGDRITISLPNSPQALIALYAVNKLGGISSMIHPLSPANEVQFFIQESRSTWALTLNAFYKNFKGVKSDSGPTKIILTKITDYLSSVKGFLFNITKGRKIKKVPAEEPVLWWQDLMSGPVEKAETMSMDPNELAVILYSGGTTGTPKGIMLSSRNFNCLGLQTAVQVSFTPGESMLAILPVFHGFGLGVCIHTLLLIGGRCILVPRFNADIVLKYLRKMRPQYMAGVPTLYEALLRHTKVDKLDLSTLKGAFAGGDSLPLSIKEKFDQQVKKSGGGVVLREGYGLTESVTACTLMPEHEYRQGSIGIPYPDMMAKIVNIGTTEEAPIQEDGELCISGPTLMLGYLDHPQETEETLKIHHDGRLWLHTGDICSMDSDGFIYFKLRLKRMIKCSGVSVYPSQVEEVLDEHTDVELSCAIGIPDPYQIQRIKAFVVLREGVGKNAEMEKKLIQHCAHHLIKWSVPAKIEFRDSLPLTLVGKVDFNKLEQEELNKINQKT